MFMEDKNLIDDIKFSLDDENLLIISEDLFRRRLARQATMHTDTERNAEYITIPEKIYIRRTNKINGWLLKKVDLNKEPDFRKIDWEEKKEEDKEKALEEIKIASKKTKCEDFITFLENNKNVNETLLDTPIRNNTQFTVYRYIFQNYQQADKEKIHGSLTYMSEGICQNLFFDEDELKKLYEGLKKMDTFLKEERKERNL